MPTKPRQRFGGRTLIEAVESTPLYSGTRKWLNHPFWIVLDPDQSPYDEAYGDALIALGIPSRKKPPSQEDVAEWAAKMAKRNPSLSEYEGKSKNQQYPDAASTIIEFMTTEIPLATVIETLKIANTPESAMALLGIYRYVEREHREDEEFQIADGLSKVFLLLMSEPVIWRLRKDPDFLYHMRNLLRRGTLDFSEYPPPTIKSNQPRARRPTR